MKPFFIQGNRGNLFSLFYPTLDSHHNQKAVLFIAPFAEEMNKCRHMMAKQARALQTQGIPSIMLDPFGTGDSEGQFSEATFDDWLSNYLLAIDYLKSEGINEVAIFGIRFGALLGVKLAESLPIQVAGFIFWQPVLKGEVMLTQFLRMKVAADMMDGGKKITTKELRQQIHDDQFVEVAGYELKSALTEAIDKLTLDALLESNTQINWFDIVPDANRGMSPVNIKFIEKLKSSGNQVNSETVIGETFWSTPELATVPELIDKSTQQLVAMLQ